MIKGMHAILYSPQAEALRAFLRDVLELSDHVDAGGGWLIFGLPNAELGVHPSETSTAHELSFWCDDLKATRARLEDRGVEFLSPITEQSFGLVTRMAMPGGVEALLYQPTHPQPKAP